MNYYILDNGSRPFKVSIENLTVWIYNNYNKLLLKLTVEKIFIGTSPINKQTLFSKGFGPEFDGNSILLKLFKNKYIFIGSSIFSFTSYSKIVKFLSPVGNNMVPYPYAIDSNNNYYLLLEKIVINENFIPKKYIMDPYDYYYVASLITPDYGFKKPKKPLIHNFKGITKFFINQDQYTLVYNSNPKKDYKRISTMGPLFIERHGKRQALTEAQYSTILTDFANEMNFKRLKAVRIIFEQ